MRQSQARQVRRTDQGDRRPVPQGGGRLHLMRMTLRWRRGTQSSWGNVAVLTRRRRAPPTPPPPPRHLTPPLAEFMPRLTRLMPSNGARPPCAACWRGATARRTCLCGSSRGSVVFRGGVTAWMARGWCGGQRLGGAPRRSVTRQLLRRRFVSAEHWCLRARSVQMKSVRFSKRLQLAVGPGWGLE